MDTQEESTHFEFSKKINFILAICAMLISIASFYVTYIQAVSSEQQVKAMTYPLVQFVTGNFNIETKERQLYVSLKNSGVGPALIKKVDYVYKGKSYPNIAKFYKACCGEEYQQFSSPESQEISNINTQIISSSDRGIVLAASDEVKIFQLLRHESNKLFWEKLNKERHKLDVQICYCSLLENCYVGDGRDVVKEVNSCS